MSLLCEVALGMYFNDCVECSGFAERRGVAGVAMCIPRTTRAGLQTLYFNAYDIPFLFTTPDKSSPVTSSQTLNSIKILTPPSTFYINVVTSPGYKFTACLQVHLLSADGSYSQPVLSSAVRYVSGWDSALRVNRLCLESVGLF
jgi:hypothetical protein